MIDARPVREIPRPIQTYPSGADQTLAGELAMRARLEPFNLVATAVFLLAILHTFAAARVVRYAHRLQRRREASGAGAAPSVVVGILHFFGEVEVVFGLWAVVLLLAVAAYAGWPSAQHYVNDTVGYTEPLFVVVIMTIAATRPIVGFAEAAMRRVAGLAGGTPAAWWCSILTLGPILGSFITEPAAMTICALLLGRRFYSLEPSPRLKYATLGLLFVNVSIGATLVPNLGPDLKLAIVKGAVGGGGLTVIANTPNPAGQALLGRFFDGAISPLGLLAGAAVPTVIAAILMNVL